MAKYSEDVFAQVYIHEEDTDKAKEIISAMVDDKFCESGTVCHPMDEDNIRIVRLTESAMNGRVKNGKGATVKEWTDLALYDLGNRLDDAGVPWHPYYARVNLGKVTYGTPNRKDCHKYMVFKGILEDGEICDYYIISYDDEQKAKELADTCFGYVVEKK